MKKDGDVCSCKPRHVAIIMDGNGRWAQQRGLPRGDGHKAGARRVRTVVRAARQSGIEFLTLFAFSSENWKRPPSEIAVLFNLLLKFLKTELPDLIEQEIRLNVIGEQEALPLPQRLALGHAVDKTRNCDKMTLNLALNYGGRAEIAAAVKKILQAGIEPEKITEELVSEYLFTVGQPDPDLVIRTSGELRISNFLLYQSAYSEFYFTPVLWPDFDEKDLKMALDEFARRNRRFGS